MSNEPRPTGSDPTAAQLKGDIDAGRTGDKIAGFDPAASPLGTDEEAGGVRPEPALVAADRARVHAAPSNVRTNAATPELAPNARLARQGYVLPAVLGILLALALAAGLLLLR